ncbi:CTQ-dependent lysine 6-oxidase LodA [Pseudoalteromonas 'SMAR']|uniref:CTQ-dependent lysine 6-oxidase LodA n=1 Tax=Pseudoalteromonas 'SMAR' TaxID=3416908 RepID=UPI003AF27AD4
MNYTLHPSVGVARLGNSDGQFYLSPDKIGGLPFEADARGNKIDHPVYQFKDDQGRIRKQGQPFKIFDENNQEITLASDNVKSITWTAHVANKKAAWYAFNELQGNLLYGEDNSYHNRQTPKRNAWSEQRQNLIIDPGPRTISGANAKAIFDKASAPANYPVSFPTKDDPRPGQNCPFQGELVTSLGEMLTDDEGRLVIIGGKGAAGGNEPLESYGGADTWHDDIADGTVYCTVEFNDGSKVSLSSWIVVGSPDFAPEIVNISNLSDTMFDVAVREQNLCPELYSNGEFQSSFVANYDRDIAPIIARIRGYQWVANVQSMSAFFANIFDFKDNSEANKANREAYFSYFRQPEDPATVQQTPPEQQTNQQLFEHGTEGHLPLMPLNSGSNSVSNAEDNIVDKFLTLTQTQYFLLSQWAAGHFSAEAAPLNPSGKDAFGIHYADQASVGNCVGLPMCPGIEVTWSMQNPVVYAAPYVIKDQSNGQGFASGLDPDRDECEGGGCQPGDLTKRMACPWQADFFNCTIQNVNFTDPTVNKINQGSSTDPHMVPAPPSYYSYWWPPQSPWDVLTNQIDDQAATHLPAGQQVNYARGINSFVQMVEHWSALAFIRNQNVDAPAFPFFTETERNHQLFAYKDVPVSDITGNQADDGTDIPVFYIPDDVKSHLSSGCDKAKMLLQGLEQKMAAPIKAKPAAKKVPRSGTRTRR